MNGTTRQWPTDPWYRENLQLSLDFFQSHMSDALWEKCFETYKEFNPIQRGGPLMMLIMLKKLQSDTEATTQYRKMLSRL